MNAFVCEPLPRQTTLVRPKKMIAKYSGAEMASASRATGCASSTITTADASPPISAAKSVQPSAFAASPALRHLVAVPQQRHVDRLAWNAEEDCREGAAIGAGDVHRRQQDDRWRDAEAIGEGQRQHDAHHERQAWQHGHQKAENQADDQCREVQRREDVKEAEAEMIQDVEHIRLSSCPISSSAIPRRTGTAPCRAAAKCRRPS